MMRKLVLTTIGAAALLLSGAASAIPIETGLVLSDPTGSSTTCLGGCGGTITIDLATGAISTSADGFYDIVGIDIEITDGDPGTTLAGGALVFDTLLTGAFAPAHYVEIAGGSLINIFAAAATTNYLGNNTLLAVNGRAGNNSDWNINGGPGGFSAGGSAAAIPEPSALALLGIGLVGFATARRKRNKTS